MFGLPLAQFVDAEALLDRLGNPFAPLKMGGLPIPRQWAEERDIHLQFIQPGNPQQNAFVERFNRTVRYEWLSQYLWADLDEVRPFATGWMYDYNHHRPHMALGGITPKQRLAMAA